MWILYAIGSAFFAGVTSVLAKCGIKKTNSDVATAIRTVVVLLFSWLMVFLTKAYIPFSEFSGRTICLLILSGLATGASWLCYFRALQLGDMNKVVPIDKSSTVLTIVIALVFLHEGISWAKGISVVFIGLGTLLMIAKKEGDYKQEALEEGDLEIGGFKLWCRKNSWAVYAVLSAVFASLTAILGKLGMTDIPSNLGTAIRTMVVLGMAWIMVFLTGKQGELKGIAKRELVFILLSGVATGASWLCYYRALQEGPASVVVPIDKLSLLVTIAFSGIVFHERLTKKATLGLIFIILGTIMLAVL